MRLGFGTPRTWNCSAANNNVFDRHIEKAIKGLNHSDTIYHSSSLYVLTTIKSQAREFEFHVKEIWKVFM
jgi:hypothetical protein